MDYRALVAAVLEENRQVLDAVNPQEIEGFIEEILRARTLHLYGMGRMQQESHTNLEGLPHSFA